MIDLPTLTAQRAVLNQPIDATLKKMLSDRIADAQTLGLADLTHFAVIEPQDTEAELIEALGFSPLASRIDEIPLEPDWDWCERHDGWWELVYTVGNSGFAYILFVQNDDRSPLARLCRGANPE